MANEQIKFTVIIPTRERCDVLESSLRTCVTQDYDNLEIIVSDNFSQDKTKKVVESFKDSRIKYINTGKRLSMSHNWEFALSHVDGGYVMYLGDDDGILPGALIELNKIINDTGCEAISWKQASYCWPSHIKEIFRNNLTIPLGSSLVKRDCQEMLTDVINYKRSYLELPNIYKGLASHNIIKKAMSQKIFFYSMTPDLYAAVALAHVLESYHYSFKVYTINGASHHSIGTSSFSTSSRLKHQQYANKFFAEKNIAFHKKLFMTPSIPILLAETFLQVQDHIPMITQSVKIDIKNVLQAAIKEAKDYPDDKYINFIEIIKKIAILNNIEHDISEMILSRHKQKKISTTKPTLGFNIIHGSISIDCTDFCVQNVYDASVLCKNIMTLKTLNYFSIKGIIQTNFALIKKYILKKFTYK